ncbi:MAG: hypothetical protein JRJ45_11070 [Deltaproteobacteria bacterium]|nr:hypothetical protein [Deltaproteobacteria bacterium]
MAKDSRKYAIEIDGILYYLSGNRLEQIVELNDIEGDKWFISDMQEAITKIMTIEAPVKYAEVMIRRNLQESGEFAEPVSIITHWKKKKGKSTTDIFFTALPTRLFYRYSEQIKEHEDSVLLFPLFSFLYYVLKHMRHRNPVAIVFQHSRFADVIVGTKKRIYYANRCVAFDTSDEQISSLWSTVKAEIKTIESENRIKIEKVCFLNWIDSGVEPEWDEDMENTFYCLEEEAIFFNEKEYHLSFLPALRMLSGVKGISSRTEKTLYYTQKWAPYLNALFLLAGLLLVAGYFWHNQKGDLLQKEVIALEGKKASLIQMRATQEIPHIEYKETFSFVKDLASYQRAPSYKEVISDISVALSSDMKVDILKMDYSRNDVVIEVFGIVKAPFGMAYKGYQSFIKILTQKRYIVKESRFNTEISNSEFFITFTKRI